MRYENLSKQVNRARVKKFVDHPQKSDHENCVAPTTFSLLNDPLIVINFFQHAKNLLRNKTPVIFDLKDVVVMGPETITYLCAFINDDSCTSNTPLQGFSPKDAKIREVFARSGFFDFVKSQNKDYNPDQEYVDKLIHRITKEQVESELAGKIVESAVHHTFGEVDPMRQKSYTMLIECMSNSWNHASPDKNIKIYNWWLLAYKEPETKITKFCFLDLGIGIFDSLEEKYKRNLLSAFFKSVINLTDNRATLVKIFSGVNRSSTKLEERGNGLYNIYKWVKSDQQIKHFTMLSNDVIAKIGYNMPDTVESLGAMFNGTMYYWELVP